VSTTACIDDDRCANARHHLPRGRLPRGRADRFLSAAVYVAVSVTGGILAACTGYLLARRIAWRCATLTVERRLRHEPIHHHSRDSKETR
jgi:hypothetical protein